MDAAVGISEDANSMNMDLEETKMDLEAIDELAWFKILSYLDKKSRLQCRELSRKIKSYVDEMGLEVKIPNVKGIVGQDKKVWQDFVATPGLYFKKITFGEVGNKPVELGILQLHRIEHLKITGRVCLPWLVNLNWVRNLTTLTLTEDALTRRLFGKQDEVPLHYLRNLELRYTLLGDPEDVDEIASFPSRYNRKFRVSEMNRSNRLLSNACALLHKIRSGFMESILLEFDILPRGDSPNKLSRAICAFVQSHFNTLTTVKYNVSFHQVLSADTEVTFEHVPRQLKELEVDFVGYCKPESAWIDMIQRLDHLETFTSRNIIWEGFEFEIPFNQNIFPQALAAICLNNFQTLKLVDLSIDRNDWTLDFGIFGCCDVLETLKLCVVYTNGEYKNVGMLPKSLVTLWVGWTGQWANPNLAPYLILDEDQIAGINNLSRLNECTIYTKVRFQSHNFLLKFVRALLRLRKLSRIHFETLSVDEGFGEDDGDHFGACVDFFRALRPSSPVFSFDITSEW